MLFGGCAHSGVQTAPSWTHFPSRTAKPSKLLSKPSRYLPLGRERASVQLLASSTDRCPSAPEEHGLDKQSRFCLLQPTKPGERKSWASWLQAPCSFYHFPLRSWLAAAAVTSFLQSGGRQEKGRAGCSKTQPTSQVTSLNPCWVQSHCPLHLSPAPSPPHSCPHRAICHSHPLVGTVVL